MDDETISFEIQVNTDYCVKNGQTNLYFKFKGVGLKN